MFNFHFLNNQKYRNIKNNVVWYYFKFERNDKPLYSKSDSEHSTVDYFTIIIYIFFFVNAKPYDVWLAKIVGLE